MKTKIVSFIGEVKRKNVTQIEYVNQIGLHVDYFVTTGFDSGKKIIGTHNNIYQLKSGFVKRCKQIYSFYKKNKKNINHVELFGGGRFGFIYVLLAKYFGLKVLLVERGGMNQYIKKENRYTTTRLSSYIQYKLADICWYKEYYMKPHLERLGVSRLNFIPNGLGHFNHEKTIDISNKEIDFLWVNRIIPERHVDWVIELAQKDEFLNYKFELYGFLDDPYAARKHREIESLELSNVRIHGYTDKVLEVYKTAKFFLLPADYVFGNNSLLEAMANCVVPIITNVHGSNNLIQNDFNGFITSNTLVDFENAIRDAVSITDKNWLELSNQAHLTVKDQYSLESFKEKLGLLYQKIDNL